MENKSHAFVAGVFTIVFLIGIAFVGIWLARDTVPQRDFYIETKDSISGLNPQARVNFKGIRVGRVTHIGFDPQTPGNIRITIRVETQTPITQTTWAVLKTQGLTGLAFIELEDEGSTGTPIALQDSFSIPLKRGNSIEDIAKKSAELLDNANLVLVDLKSLMRAGSNSGIPALVQELKQTAQSTRQVLDGVLPVVEQMRPLAENMTSATQSVVQITQQVDGFVQRLVGVGGTMDKIGSVLENVADSSRGAGQMVQQIKTNPQSILFGVERKPGPGEPGFSGF